MNNTIPKQVVAGLKSVVTETVEKTAEEAGKIVTGVISAGELLPGVKSLSPEEEIREKQKAEDKRQEELKKVREQMCQGRNVETEIKEIGDDKDKKDEEEERIFLENIRRQREMEAAERQQIESGVSSNPAKQKKSRGSAFAKGKKKSQPQMDQMTATGEFKGKVD